MVKFREIPNIDLFGNSQSNRIDFNSNVFVFVLTIFKKKEEKLILIDIKLKVRSLPQVKFVTKKKLHVYP